MNKSDASNELSTLSFRLKNGAVFDMVIEGLVDEFGKAIQIDTKKIKNKQFYELRALTQEMFDELEPIAELNTYNEIMSSLEKDAGKSE